jgi:hypothetical protein
MLRPPRPRQLTSTLATVGSSGRGPATHLDVSTELIAVSSSSALLEAASMKQSGRIVGASQSITLSNPPNSPSSQFGTLLHF